MGANRHKSLAIIKKNPIVFNRFFCITILSGLKNDKVEEIQMFRIQKLNKTFAFLITIHNFELGREYVEKTTQKLFRYLYFFFSFLVIIKFYVISTLNILIDFPS